MKCNYLSFVILAIVITSCSPEPQPINFGKEECTLCKMTISQRQWGAEIVTAKSRTMKFDAAECMAKYINDQKIKQTDIHSCWVIDYGNPGQLINCDKASFLHSLSLPSPMAMFLTAFSSKDVLKKTMKEHPGEVMNWNGVLHLVKTEWGD